MRLQRTCEDPTEGAGRLHGSSKDSKRHQLAAMQDDRALDERACTPLSSQLTLHGLCRMLCLQRLLSYI